MITKAAHPDGKMCQVTFVLRSSSAPEPVSICGDFNQWSATTHPLINNHDGTYSATIDLPANQRFAYKYLSEKHGWFNDDAADGYECNEWGECNSILVTDLEGLPVLTPSPGKAAKKPARKLAAKGANKSARKKAVKKKAAKKKAAKKAAAKKSPPNNPAA